MSLTKDQVNAALERYRQNPNAEAASDDDGPTRDELTRAFTQHASPDELETIRTNEATLERLWAGTRPGSAGVCVGQSFWMRLRHCLRDAWRAAVRAWKHDPE